MRHFSAVFGAALALWFAPDPFIPDRQKVSFLHVPAVPGLRFESVTLFSEQGNLVREIRQAVEQDGHWLVSWDGNDREGQLVPAGVFYAHLKLIRDGVAEQSVVPVVVLRTTGPAKVPVE
jgi:hypothetical protein